MVNVEGDLGLELKKRKFERDCGSLFMRSVMLRKLISTYQKELDEVEVKIKFAVEELMNESK